MIYAFFMCNARNGRMLRPRIKHTVWYSSPGGDLHPLHPLHPSDLSPHILTSLGQFIFILCVSANGGHFEHLM